MILKIDESIKDETVDKLVSFYNNFNPRNENEKAIIYFSSTGGDRACMEAMINMINIYGFHTILIGYRNLFSCGFELFYTVKCHQKIVLGECMGMYHQCSLDVRLNEFLKPEYKSDKAKLIYMEKSMRQITEDFCKELKFTDKEVRKIRKGDDVYFQPDRMKEFLSIIETKA